MFEDHLALFYDTHVSHNLFRDNTEARSFSYALPYKEKKKNFLLITKLSILDMKALEYDRKDTP